MADRSYTADAVRRPRVQIAYDADVDGVRTRTELPFVIGVLADLCGQPQDHPPPLRDRKFVRIDRRTFDQVLADCAPRLVLHVDNRLADDGSQLLVELTFRRRSDFEPAGVAAQIAPLKALVERRRRLTRLIARSDGNGTRQRQLASRLAPRLAEVGVGTPPVRGGHAAGVQDVAKAIKFRIAHIDEKLCEQLNEVIHHPDFQRLEAAWRGLDYLVSNVETGPTLKVKVLAVSKKELYRDLEKAAEFDQGALFKKVYEEEYGQLGGEPYGLLVGDYEFGRSADDVALLQRISHVAAAAHAPFVATAATSMFGMERFAELSAPRDLTKIFAGADYAAWRSFRASEDARYVALTLPHVLARLPYAAAASRGPAFLFSEDVSGPDPSRYLWMSAAWAYAGRAAAAFADDGWFMQTRGVEGGGRVDGLPVHAFATDDGGVAVKAPTEVAVSDRREFELSNLGFLPLLAGKDREFAVFMGAQSCQKPKVYTDPAATANAELSAKFNYLLSVSRFAHYLKVMARDQVGSSIEPADLERLLHDWLMEYVIGNPESASDEVKAQKPLAAAEVKVCGVKGKPGWYEAVAYLRPHYQLESMSTSMRLVAEIPKRT